MIDEPEYYNIIPRPMSFQTIEDKLGADRYTTCSQFEVRLRPYSPDDSAQPSDLLLLL